MYFRSGRAETDYLKARDPVLGELIEKIGPVRREVDPDLFSSVVHHVVGQQVSTKAQATIWARLQELLGTVDSAHVLARTPAELQSVGMTFRKVDYIREFARRVSDGEFDLAAVAVMPDEEAIRMLGEGWVAEETLAIAVYCALKYKHNFDRALIAAVNHDGDSDSTGAVTGNLLGASLGLSGIPLKYQYALELREIILELADDLYHGCPVGYGRLLHRTHLLNCADGLSKRTTAGPTYGGVAHTACGMNPRAGRAGKEFRCPRSYSALNVEESCLSFTLRAPDRLDRVL